MKPGDPPIKLTVAAAEQIKKSSEVSGSQGWPLRIAVRRDESETFQYAMGFDARSHEDDISFKSEGVDCVIRAGMLTLLKGMAVDYVEIEKGRHNFIFLNPNDESYVAPKE